VKGIRPAPDPSPDLVRAAAEGDRESLKRLLLEASPWVGQWALAHCGDPDDAQDLVQEVLVQLVRRLPSYRGDARFLTWLFSVTRNRAVEAHRKKGRQERKMARWQQEALGASQGVPDAEARTDQERIRKVIDGFLEELPQRQREVFQLSELQGLPSPEIGAILGLEAGSVRAALFKARRTLRRRILQSHPELVEEYTP
jgi:RNA polymerase sigma-70 factor (ECF subfamily)